jgi:hypothetical protein
MNDPLPGGCYVMLHIAAGPSCVEERDGPQLVVKDKFRFTLNEDIWIERLDQKLATQVQRACEPPNYNIDGYEKDRHLYALVRRVPEIETSRNEGMDELFAVSALSRLIHPTSIGHRYCAKVFWFGRTDSPIQAVQYRGISPDVFLSSGHRDWLSLEDAEKLRSLMPWVAKNKRMHRRIHRAYWNHEYAMRSYYLDMRWILVVSGLEALITIDEHGLAKQFRDGVQQLAREFQIDFTETNLSHAWKLRSKLVHAEGFLHGLETILPNSQQTELYQRLEDLLRLTLRRSLLDEAFGNLFRDNDTLRKWLRPAH